MKDVAKLAGVSTATVSRAFSHPEKLSSPTRYRVEEAAISCGYSTLNTIPSSLAPVILAIVPEPENPTYLEIIRGINAIITTQHYVLLINYQKAQPSEFTCLQHFSITRHICGVIHIGTQSYSAWLKQQQIESIPQIMIGCSGYSTHTIIIDIDHLAAAFNAVSYLCQSGHSRIAYIGGTAADGINNYHEQGYKQALQRWKIACEPTYSVYGDLSFEQGQRAVDQLMSLPVPPNAIYCCHDLLAIGAIHQIEHLGYSVPQHISVVGFGDMALSRYHKPALTTVQYPAYQIGQQAASALIEWLKRPALKPKSYLFNSELVQRNTTIQRQY